MSVAIGWARNVIVSLIEAADKIDQQWDEERWERFWRLADENARFLMGWPETYVSPDAVIEAISDAISDSVRDLEKAVARLSEAAQIIPQPFLDPADSKSLQVGAELPEPTPADNLTSTNDASVPTQDPTNIIGDSPITDAPTSPTRPNAPPRAAEPFLVACEPGCGRTFGYGAALGEHMRTCEVVLAARKAPATCDECGRTFTSAPALNGHRRSHAITANQQLVIDAIRATGGIQSDADAALGKAGGYTTNVLKSLRDTGRLPADIDPLIEPYRYQKRKATGAQARIDGARDRERDAVQATARRTLDMDRTRPDRGSLTASPETLALEAEAVREVAARSRAMEAIAREHLDDFQARRTANAKRKADEAWAMRAGGKVPT